jgi:hypothetical protein
MDCEDKFESKGETKTRKKGNPAWQKGMASPNAGGRPAVIRDLREAAQGYSAEALETLASVMRDQASPPAAKVAAARELLDRGFGKAVQAVDVNSKVDMGATAAAVLMDLANRAKTAKAAELVRAEAISIDYKDVTLKNLPS